MDFIQNTDIKFLEFLRDNFNNTVLDNVFFFITKLGDVGVIWIIVSIVLIMTKKYRRAGFLTAFALLLATLLGEGMLKHIFQRTRPFLEYGNLPTMLSHQTGYSFPSGHTASAFACTGILMSKLERLKYIFLLLAFSISFSRLYFFVHYPSDVIAGAFLGLFSAWFVLKLDHLAPI